MICCVNCNWVDTGCSSAVHIYTQTIYRTTQWDGTHRTHIIMKIHKRNKNKIFNFIVIYNFNILFKAVCVINFVVENRKIYNIPDILAVFIFVWCLGTVMWLLLITWLTKWLMFTFQITKGILHILLLRRQQKHFVYDSIRQCTVNCKNV